MNISSSKPAVLSVGRLYCDLIFTDLPRLPTLGTEVFTDGFGAHAGGGAFITAAHLAQLGHTSALAAMLPASPFADLMRPELEASNVDLSLSAPLAETSGPQITVAMATADDRAFLTRRAGPAFPDVSAMDLKKRGIRHIHVGELASLTARPEIIDIARSNDMTLSADCGWDDELDPECLNTLRGTVDVFLPNEAEFAALAKLGLPNDFSQITVIKRGASGSIALTQAGAFDAPTQALPAKDSTGAGDAFNAGFLSSWLVGRKILDCLNAGNARGALTVQRRGGFRADSAETNDIGIASE